MFLLVACATLPAKAKDERSSLSQFIDIVFRRGLTYQVDENAEFIGKNLTLPNATTDLSWLYPDWDSIAQQLAIHHKFKADNQAARFLRSFEIPNDDQYGYVWHWQHNGQPVYLMFMAEHRSGFDVRLLLNTHNITVDEAIIATHYSDERSYYKPFKVEKWVIEGIDSRYQPDSLNHLGDQFFSEREYYKPLEGQIITLPYTELKYHSDNLWLYSNYHDKQHVVPFEFANELPAPTMLAIKDSEKIVSADLKVSLTKEGNIAEVVAATVYLGDYYDRTVLYSKPVPRGLPGAGALPIVEVDE